MTKYFLFLFLLFQVNNLHAQKCNAISIYFKPTMHVLTEENKTEIKRVYSAVSPFKLSGVLIEGRSDTTGSEKTNLMLSQKRIDAALYSLKPLLNKSVQIEIKNYGESNPISLTDLNKNRSVKITFILDTLINLAKQEEGEIWLNTKLLGNIDSCNFTIKVTPYIRKQYNSTYYSFIPLSEKISAYQVHIFFRCLDVYIFPDTLYDPITHIGRFVTPVNLWYCSTPVDSINFSYPYLYNQMQYDSLSRSYYLITDCHNQGAACCAGGKTYCHSYAFVPEETITHVTKFPYINEDRDLDTIVVKDEHVWQDWGCTSFLIASLDTTPYIYSVAMFDSVYHYLKGDITHYKRTDTSTFEFLGEKYQAFGKTEIYQLHREDYTSFTAPTNKRLFIKTKRGYIPGVIIKEYDIFIPFEHVRKRKYKGYVIDYPIEFALKYSNAILKENKLTVKNKIKKSKNFMKLKVNS